MIESIEGKRGLPPHRPHLFVAASAAFSVARHWCTNVETLHWVPYLSRKGPQC